MSHPTHPTHPTQPQPSQPPPLIVSVDIKTLGNRHESEPFSVGFCYGTTWLDRKKYRITIRPSSYSHYYADTDTDADTDTKETDDNPLFDETFLPDWEQICDPVTYEGFWKNHEMVLRNLWRDALHPKKAWKEIDKFIKTIYNIAEEDNNEVIWISDNPSYDFSHLDHGISKYLDQLPVRFSNRQTKSEIKQYFKENNKYPDSYENHCIEDPSEQIKFHPHKNIIEKIVKTIVQHTHYPDKDAEEIYLTYLLLTIVNCDDIPRTEYHDPIYNKIYDQIYDKFCNEKK
jgi:hypothetical protein